MPSLLSYSRSERLEARQLGGRRAGAAAACASSARASDSTPAGSSRVARHATASAPTVIGADCVVGHNAHLEGCTVEDACLIGSMSIVLKGAVVRTGALVGAHALVANGVEVPSRAMALGVPARMREDAVAEGAFARTVALYVANAEDYAANLRRMA